MALPFNASFAGGAAVLPDPPFKEYRGSGGTTTVSRNGSSLAVASFANVDSITIDDSNTYTNGQHSQITINTVVTSSDYAYIVINASGDGSSGSRYFLWWNSDGSDIALNRASGVAWGGDTTEATTTSSGLTTGDTLDLINDGAGHITVKHNGTLVPALSFTDGTPLTGGLPGFGMFATSTTSVKISAWTADDVSSGISLTGQTITSSEGTLTRALSQTVTGQTGTLTEGTPSRAVSYSPTAQTATFSEGVQTRNITYGLTGQTATFSEGTISASSGGNVTLSLSGQSVTLSEGTIGLNLGYSLNDGVPLTGQTANFTEGTPTNSVTYGLTGQTVTLTEGTITSQVGGNVTLSLTGQTITLTEGLLLGSVSYGITGRTSTFTEGNIGNGGLVVALTGQTIQGISGTVTQSGGTSLGAPPLYMAGFVSNISTFMAHNQT